MNIKLALIGATLILAIFICPPSKYGSWSDNWVLKIFWIILFLIGVFFIVMSFFGRYPLNSFLLHFDYRL